MDRNKEVARRWFEEVWNERKTELFDDLAMANATGYDMEGPGVATVGKQAFLDFHKKISSAVPDLRFQILDNIAEGDKVVIRIQVRGTHTGDQLGVPATGNRIEFGAVAIFRFEDGRLAEAWNHIDQLAFYQQLRILNVS